MNSSHIHARDNARPISEARPTGQQFLTGLALSGGTGVLAALCSLVGKDDWYRALIKPIWAPAIWAFAPIQLAVYIFAGVALAYLLASQAPHTRKKVVLSWFWVQLALGVMWSFCFFVLHSSAWAYVWTMLLWCAVVALMWTGSRLSRRAFWFLTPLSFWATFSSSLVFAVLSFNVLRQESARMDADPRNKNSPADPPIIVRKR